MASPLAVSHLAGIDAGERIYSDLKLVESDLNLSGEMPKGLTKGKKPGAVQIGLARGETEAFDVLLEPNIYTYQDGATRIGISLEAFKQRMSRGKNRIKVAQSLTNWGNEWKRKRKMHVKERYRKPTAPPEAPVE